MAIQVLNISDKLKYFEYCDGCYARLAFSGDEVKEEEVYIPSSDLDGDSYAKFKYVICPRCRHKVGVSNDEYYMKDDWSY